MCICQNDTVKKKSLFFGGFFFFDFFFLGFFFFKYIKMTCIVQLFLCDDFNSFAAYKIAVPEAKMHIRLIPKYQV